MPRTLSYPPIILRSVIETAMATAQPFALDFSNALRAIFGVQILNEEDTGNGDDRKAKAKQPPEKGASAFS